MKFSYANGDFQGTFELTLPDAQQEYFTKILGVGIYVKNVTLNDKGVLLDLAGHKGGGRLLQEPVGWGKFWRTGTPEISGIAACIVWTRWLEFVDNKNAGLMVQQIEDGAIGFNDVKLINEQLLHHDKVKQSLSCAVADGSISEKLKAKQYRGFEKLTDKEWELYNWATWIYISSISKSWEDSCADACEKHPELVPVNWTEPGGSLKRKANRYMDKHPLRRQTRSMRNLLDPKDSAEDK